MAQWILNVIESNPFLFDRFKDKTHIDGGGKKGEEKLTL